MDFGMGMNMNMFRRPAKMPLSPISRPVGEKTALETNDKTMPLVLPFAAANIKPQVVKPTPVKLMPAKLSEEQKPQPLSLEDNIEKNLRSFLQDTRDLEWDNVTVVELKRILRQYELNATGKKAELMQRIKKIRLSYHHLDGVVENERSVKAGIKRTESSPETMGSDAGLDEATMGKSLDELFAGALEIPPGSEMLFS
jgi:transglutaminase-like putative cysteine protease